MGALKTVSSRLVSNVSNVSFASAATIEPYKTYLRVPPGHAPLLTLPGHTEPEVDELEDDAPAAVDLKSTPYVQHLTSRDTA